VTENPRKKILIAPSILSADFSRLGDEIREVEEAGADWIHVDVMDGHFVPNLTIGPVVVQGLRKATKIPLDVHLMIEEPWKYFSAFKEAGADWITVHYEACSKNLSDALRKIRETGLRCGISIRPKTDPEVLEPFWDETDLILVMTVEPGFGGQAFMPEAIGKVPWIRKKYKGLISVDGGINEKTAHEAIRAGTDILVAGTAVFGKPDRKRAIEALLAR